MGAFLAAGGVPRARHLIWVTVAMVGARSLAMALNRLIDAGVDARNPRTAGRELPRGELLAWHVVAFAVLSLGVFLVAVFQLEPVVRWLWPIPVAAFVLYPYLKRFTWLCHAWLGLVLGIAPIAGWIAVAGDAPWPVWIIGLAVAAWVAGFDVLYALFDIDVDRAQGLRSVPARFGTVVAFRVARCAHLATVICFALAGLGLDVGAFYWLGVVAAAVLLGYEHAIVSPRDLRRLDTAFFTTNGVISIVFFVFVLTDVLAR